MGGQSFASERLHGIATRLRVEGERGLQREMYGVFRTVAQPLKDAARSAALQKLPKSGGLAQDVADQVTVRVTSGARTAGVSVRTKTLGTTQTNSGYVRHPVFGAWLPNQPSQEIPGAAGWWTDALQPPSAAVTPLLIAEMNRVGRIIQGGY